MIDVIDVINLFITSSAFLDLSAVQNVNPVGIHMAVSAYLLPLLNAGWNSPIKSIAMNYMGWGGDKNVHFSDVVFGTYLASGTVLVYRFLQSFPVVSVFK